MIERYTEALEQYDLEVEEVRRGRGAWLCQTRQGLKILKEYRGTVRRLEFEDQVLTQADTGGQLRLDRYVRNKEGSLLSIGGDGTRYVLRDWFDCRECDLKDGGQVRLAASRLGLLHQRLRQVPFCQEWNLGSILIEPIEQELERHNREMKRARNFIRGKKQKTEFELCVMETYEMFYGQALQAAAGLSGLWQEERPSYLCHGDMDQHHALMGSGFTAIVEFNRMHLGLQLQDLYRFMRKAMEKHGWNTALGRSVLEAYQKILPLESREYRCLYYLFLYPEKYWKQINFYYNANKAWIPARNTAKLQNLKEQQPARERFLREVFPGLN